ncbi:3-dehydroshikimate dehydratase [Pseudohyphozyma bogoriensis]|nr:3-dehydroshikimate dehydratase [Pseudohyphozyma bogoriensis]
MFSMAEAEILPFSTLTPSDHPLHPYSNWTPGCAPPPPIGRLALLTPERVERAAREEIRTGKRISLDIPISTNSPEEMLGRKRVERHVVRIDGGPSTSEESQTLGQVYQPVHDDVLTVNTQGTTQWDGFYHFSYPGSGLFYGGATTADVFAGNINDGMLAWANAGGIVGRAVLIDYARYAEQKGIHYDACLDSHAIPLSAIKEIAASKGVEFRVGDILVVRTGFDTRFNELVAQNLSHRVSGHYAGVEQGKETLRWLWETGFAAVAGDQPAFERWPSPSPQDTMHPILLSGWGLPIGELLALEEVAAELAKRDRATFFLCAVPLKSAKAGLWTIELAYECLEAYAKSLKVDSSDPKDALREAARQTNALARELGLVLAAIDAFEGYEGLVDRTRHAALVEDFKFWVELCGIMGIEIIQIPATFDPKATLDESLVVPDLRELCDLGLAASPPVQIAYEPMGWSTFTKTWEEANKLIKAVDRRNIGLCLDVFHTASLLWGSPETKDGKRPGGDQAYKDSLDRLRKIPASDILLFQISDGAFLSPPMPESAFTEPEIDNLFAWSKHGRPYPGEGYFPVNEFCEAVFATGFKGVTTMEVFDDEGFDRREAVPAERAARTVKSWVGISEKCGLAPFYPPTPAGVNKLGTCTVNLGHYELYTLEEKLFAAAATGHKAIDLYEDDLLYYLSLQPGANMSNLWEANPVHLHAVKKIGDLIASLGMELICFQPLIDVEGLVIPAEREAAIQRCKAYFPYMRQLRTTVTYITTNRRYDFENITGDIEVIAKDLAYFANLAAEYAKADGGPMIKIGYEHLAWGSFINTFDKTWEAIELANRPNLGFVFDTFNFLGKEFANPYNPAGHGRIHDTIEESTTYVRQRLAKLAKLIPGDKIYVCQVADANLADPKSLPVPTPATEKWTPQHEPPFFAWSSGHRLFPNEPTGYMPVAECLAAILATGYKGAFTNEIFNTSYFEKGDDVVASHAKRSFAGVASCVEDAKAMKPWW